MHVAARLARAAGDAVDGAHRLAVDEDDALITLAHFGLVALDLDRLAVELREHFEERGEVLVIRLHVKHTGAAITEQGLEDDVLVLGAEGQNLAPVAGDERRRHHVFELGDRELLRRVAHMGGIVHHQGLGVDALQNMGRGDIGHVEGGSWRIRMTSSLERSSTSSAPRVA